MDLNSDFSKRVAVHAAKMPWKNSPMPGVERRMLDRLGDEVARATSIVRYAPQSAFSAHTHTGGEEFFVLDGVFQDEHGDFPAGSYVRNPPQSKHTPGSATGCTILVKLWQFDPDDRTHVNIDTNTMPFRAAPDRNGIEELSLFSDKNEQVRLEKWPPVSKVELDADGGMEVFVLAGCFAENQEIFESHSWLRLPPGAKTTATSGEYGAYVWIKRGHLSKPPAPPSTER